VTGTARADTSASAPRACHPFPDARRLAAVVAGVEPRLRRGVRRGDIAIDGDLEEVLTALAFEPKQGFLRRWLRRAAARSLPREKADIEHHYGLRDAFYQFYLDKKLQYSCAYFRTPEDSLDLAQEQKIAYTAAKLHL
jgi:hypothetical protein